MPLLFASRSHGTVVFGFYNIETDHLLLEDLGFFCDDFCQGLSALPPEGGTFVLEGHRFRSPEDLGDLMGAIRGERYLGYLGEVYRRWPFPSDPREFRQKIRGHENRGETLRILRRWADPETIPVVWRPGEDEGAIGPYRFSRDQFRDLLRYVFRGGYPTWEGFLEQGECPPWVADMGRKWGLLPGSGGSER
ncbi:hypothetical protein [Deferrisoma sp.]